MAAILKHLLPVQDVFTNAATLALLDRYFPARSLPVVKFLGAYLTLPVTLFFAGQVAGQDIQAGIYMLLDVIFTGVDYLRRIPVKAWAV